jgi:predicted HD phosphohydrolase
MSIPIYSSNPDVFISDLTDWYNTSGQNNYNEVVTISDHMLQAATIAHDEGANKTDVLSCLFHDIGHMIIDDDDNYVKDDRNKLHETVAAEYLSKIFIDDVIGPIKNHVNAKRWLCSTDKTYYDFLSHASKQSFEEQGGYMTVKEMESFSSSKYFHHAIKVREIDDRAKIKDKSTNSIQFYRSYIIDCLLS